MKKALLTLLLTGIFALAPLYAQESYGDFLQKLIPETSKFKYIPFGAPFSLRYFKLDGIKNRIFTLYLYDKDGDGTYKNPDGTFQDGEAFIDFNNDSIPDMPLDNFYNLYEKEKSRKILARTTS